MASIKPEVVKSSVITRAALGHSKTQIAKELAIAPGTVRAILSEADFAQVLSEARSSAARLLPKAIEHIEYELDKRKPGAGFRLLEGAGILGSKDAQGAGGQTIEINVTVQSVSTLGEVT